MWRNFSFPCGEISAFHVEKFQMSFIAIYAVLLLNLFFTMFVAKFCHNLRAFMWRKIEPKSTFVEKKSQMSGLGPGPRAP